MFTGLIEEIGKVQSIIKSARSAKIKIKASKVIENIKLGDSISTNGVCLTVTEFTSNNFVVDVMAETMRKSSLSVLSAGDEINLERALRVGDRLGGHLVSGHIDGIGTISSCEKEDNAVWLSVSTVPEILRYIVQKGSITIDGVSLTIAYVDEKLFKVSIIPHTNEVTTLLRRDVGDIVNLECDVVGKYIEKLILFKEEEPIKQNINMDFLSQNGFI